MSRPFSWLRRLRSFGLELWLPLPLLGFGFWLLSGWITQQTLNQPIYQVTTLQIRPQKPPPQRVVSIKVEPDPLKGTSQVTVKSVAPTLTEQIFELPTTQPAQLEAAISQKLNLPAVQISNMVQYQNK